MSLARVRVARGREPDRQVIEGEIVPSCVGWIVGVGNEPLGVSERFDGGERRVFQGECARRVQFSPDPLGGVGIYDFGAKVHRGFGGVSVSARGLPFEASARVLGVGPGGLMFQVMVGGA